MQRSSHEIKNRFYSKVRNINNLLSNAWVKFDIFNWSIDKIPNCFCKYKSLKGAFWYKRFSPCDIHKILNRCRAFLKAVGLVTRLYQVSTRFFLDTIIMWLCSFSNKSHTSVSVVMIRLGEVIFLYRTLLPILLYGLWRDDIRGVHCTQALFCFLFNFSCKIILKESKRMCW